MSHCCWVRPRAAVKWHMSILFAFVFCMGMGCGLNTEKQEGLRNVQKNVHGWSALEGAGRAKQGVLRDVSLLRASFPSKSPTFSSFGHLLPTAWGMLAWWRSAQSCLSFFFPLILFSGEGITAMLGSTEYLLPAKGTQQFTAAPSVLPVVCNPYVILSHFCEPVKEAAFLSRGKA